MGPNSLYQETLLRVSDPCRYTAPLVLTHSDYRFVVAEQAQDLGLPLLGVLVEPVCLNTAVAIAAAAVFAVHRIAPDAVLHILPSDHAVLADESYWRAVDMAAEAARANRLITFGITPTAPETGYGYIQSGAALDYGVYEVSRFIEKPDRAFAEEMLEAGNHVWNSGMFMFDAKLFLEEAQKLAPETHKAAMNGVLSAKADLDFIRIDEASFASAPDISVDYAIFEKTDRAAVLPVNFQWSDLGAWDAVWTASKKDGDGNVTMGSATFSNVGNSLVVSEKAHVVVEGLSDIAVIASEDAVFVGRLSDAQKMGQIVGQLKKQPNTLSLTESHRTAYRPWGGYCSVLNGERFQVKRLFVKPGRKLSLQRHHHRSEHWIVVRGTAEVTIDGHVQIVCENQSVYLPLGCTHRLANPGRILLELIEVQTGSYLEEDDIVRMEDEFGRV